MDTNPGGAIKPGAGGKPPNPMDVLGKQIPGKPPPLTGEMPIMNSMQLSLIVVPTVLYAIATAAVVGRIWARRFKQQTFGPDDALCILALIFGYVQHATVLILVLGGGLALPIMSLSLPTIKEMLQALISNVVMYITTTTVLQLAVVFFYIRLFGVQKSFRIVCWVVIGLVAAWGIMGVLTRIFTCGSQVSKAVYIIDTSIPGKCANDGAICAATAISHVILDGSIVLMPIPMVWKLQMSTFNKVVVTLVLCSGVFATVCAILRMHCMINLYTENPNDPTMALGPSTLYQSIEAPIGLICICIPTYAPLWTKFSESRLGSYAKRLLSSRGTRSSDSAMQTGHSYNSKASKGSYDDVYSEKQAAQYHAPAPALPRDAGARQPVCSCPVHPDANPNNPNSNVAFPYAGRQPPNERIHIVRQFDVERT